jgi:hypothetical protein
MKVTITRIVKRLTVLLDDLKSWLKTNWKKLIVIVDGIIVSKSVVYESRCWSCKNPIRSIKNEYRLVGWIQSKWLGNKKCIKPDCNYFICNHCSKCLCDGPYAHLKSKKPYVRKWVVEESLTYSKGS